MAVHGMVPLRGAGRAAIPGRASASLFTFSGMANNRKPINSPSRSAGDSRQIPSPHEPELLPADVFDSPDPSSMADSDLTLDDYQEKTQARPRLPDQRRDQPPAEMGGLSAAAREAASPPPPAPVEHFESKIQPKAWKPAALDEIADYDLSVPDAEDLTLDRPKPAAKSEAKPAPKPEPKAAPAASKESTAGLDDLEEFMARAGTAGSTEAKAPKVRRPLSLVEKVCLGVGGFAILGLCGWLIRAVTSESNGSGVVSEAWPDLPLKGEIVTVSGASSGWRKRAESDRVAQMEVILPEPGFKMPEIIPQVNFTIDSAESRDGYLRFIFKDSEGNPRGDTRVVHLAGGKLTDLGTGEIIKSGTEGTIYGSFGLPDTGSYYSYISSNDARWSVEVAESPTYQAADKDWKVLDTFDVRNDLVQ